MKKISKALSVLCSITTLTCMLGTNPAIAMVRDDGAAAGAEKAARRVTHDSEKIREAIEAVKRAEKELELELEKIECFSNRDIMLDLGEAFKLGEHDLKEKLRELKALRKKLEEVGFKKEPLDDHTRKLLDSASNVEESSREFIVGRRRKIGKYVIKLIYFKFKNLEFFVRGEYRNNTSHPDVWAAGFLSLLDLYHVAKPDESYYIPMYDAIVNNEFNTNSPVFCAFAVFAKFVGQFNDLLLHEVGEYDLIDFYIKMAIVSDVTWMKDPSNSTDAGKAVNKCYREDMIPYGIPGEDSVREINKWAQRVIDGDIVSVGHESSADRPQQ